MSGHSKWAQIKRQKGAADVKRGLAFTKLSNAITMAVRQGKGTSDPEQNFKLRLAIDQARAANMPKDTIARAVEKGKGSAKGEELHEVIYEGFGPGGVAVIVEATTDNKLRTVSEIKNVFEKNGGIPGNTGSVSYQFQAAGQITVSKNGKSFDDIFDLAADAGAEDVQDAGDEVLIYVRVDALSAVSEKLAKSLSVIDSERIRKPLVTVAISDKETARKVLDFLEKIESLDDVQKVYVNFDIPDGLIEGNEH